MTRTASRLSRRRFLGASSALALGTTLIPSTAFGANDRLNVGCIGIGGVILDEIVPDMSNLAKILKPGHPDADEQGYVTMPNVKLPIEMMNLNIAVRTYQANVAILKRYQQMVDVTLELLK